MKSYLCLIKAEVILLFGELKNYLLNYVFYNIGLLFLFIGLMYNYGYSFALLISLLLWYATTSSTSYLSSIISEEAMMGTLEQIFLTKTKIQTVMSSKIFVNLIFTLLKTFLLLIISLAFIASKIDLSLSFIEFVELLMIFMLTTVSFYYLGEFFGGLSLYYKRVSSILSVFTNILLLFSGVFTPINIDNPMFYLTPLPASIKLINMLINDEYNDFVLTIIIYLTLISVYIFGGIITFNFYLKKAKKDGKLNQY